MKYGFTAEDRKKIEEGVREKYSKVAVNPDGLFSYPTGREGLAALKYDPDILGSLPEAVLDSFCGVGNPFSTGAITPGESVLDIGCGGGTDALVAAIMTGPTGRVVGIDLSSEMLGRAWENLSRTDLKNVSFQECSAEDLPFRDADFDVVISSGAFNLIPDKPKALKEVLRVLKPGGHLVVADQVLTGPLSEDVKARIDNWSG
ncbi:methylase involved in ubiquinone/menaquinone biosynthesis [Desulfomonile tiedjei DSM 6799]|uniref:Arsenite methyltransferase n=2 Tax=Desulfomonile tiedjei TaxID=2358 RepID=I4C0B5_DESTA|nr:methyltransferase domain-containing protein [Desulfomonile tiedjei]AFM23006.1 methylase involved in ubiquinone/menaquinone biosynthesis [Desulfomonile tiedjei DSM 6799]